MKIAHIVPPQWVDIFPKGEYRMALAHWVFDFPDYAKDLCDKEAYILMDSGTFENRQVTITRMNEAAAALGADEVVLPDVAGEPKKTLKLSWAALGKVASTRVMFVPQGRSEHARSDCLQAWLEKWEGSEWSKTYQLSIGISSLREPAGTESVVGSRYNIIHEAATTGYSSHLLGLTDLREFASEELSLARALGVRGMDTSTAFALGARSILVTRSAPKYRLGDPAQYEMLSSWSRRLIHLNMVILDWWVDTGATTIPTNLIRQTASRWLRYYAEGFAKLEDTMQACGMPKGCYALLKKNGYENSVRPFGDDDYLEEGETCLNL